MKKHCMLAALIAVMFVVSGCTTIFPDPLQKAESTPVPGITAALHSPLTSDNDRNNQMMTLYFRYGREPMLAAEARYVAVSQNESAELALVKAMLSGPGAGTTDLTRLFQEQVQVINTISHGDILYVTFNDALLKPYSDEPSEWQNSAEWQREVIIRRKLAMAGLTASIIENFPYQSVQVLVQQRSDVSTSLRLDNAYFQDASKPNGLALPFKRDESLLLTQENTIKTIIAAWQEKDWSRLYNYLASYNQSDGQARPSRETAFAQWDNAAAVTGVETTGGSVSPDGSRAVVNVSMTLNSGNELEKSVFDCPVTLHRDKGIWKISYEQLTTLMNLTAEQEAE